MKTRFFFLVFLSLVLIGCSEPFTHEVPRVYSLSPIPQTKGDGVQEYVVSLEDLYNYINYKSLLGVCDNKYSDILPIYRDSILVYYIINYIEGWEIVSADKRTPVILASSPSGRFVLDSIIDAEKEWMDSIAEEIIKLKQEWPRQGLETANDSVYKTLDFWSAINADPSFINSDPIITKVGGLGDGIWVLDSVIQREEVDIDVDHYISTTWHQYPPYNNYCPYIHLGQPERALAGCVPVAGAQMLHHLHYYLGQPVLGPTYASCEMEIGNNPSPIITTGGASSSVWDYMRDDASAFTHDTAAVLIADVAKKVGASFIIDSLTSASAHNLVSTVFEPYGIECEYYYFNNDTIINNLFRSLPVIVKGGISVEFESPSHTFIIDGIRVSRTVSTFHYTWVQDGYDDPFPLEKKIVVRSPDIIVYRMNWGWSNQYHRDVDYSPSGNWETFNYNRGVIAGFKAVSSSN